MTPKDIVQEYARLVAAAVSIAKSYPYEQDVDAYDDMVRLSIAVVQDSDMAEIEWVKEGYDGGCFSETFQFPSVLLSMSAEDLNAWRVDLKRKEDEAAAVEKARRAAAAVERTKLKAFTDAENERAEYARLKAKFEGGS